MSHSLEKKERIWEASLSHLEKKVGTLEVAQMTMQRHSAEIGGRLRAIEDQMEDQIKRTAASEDRWNQRFSMLRVQVEGDVRQTLVDTEAQRRDSLAKAQQHWAAVSEEAHKKLNFRLHSFEGLVQQRSAQDDALAQTLGLLQERIVQVEHVLRHSMQAAHDISEEQLSVNGFAPPHSPPGEPVAGQFGGAFPAASQHGPEAPALPRRDFGASPGGGGSPIAGGLADGENRVLECEQRLRELAPKVEHLLNSAYGDAKKEGGTATSVYGRPGRGNGWQERLEEHQVRLDSLAQKLGHLDAHVWGGNHPHGSQEESAAVSQMLETLENLVPRVATHEGSLTVLHSIAEYLAQRDGTIAQTKLDKLGRSYEALKQSIRDALGRAAAACDLQELVTRMSRDLSPEEAEALQQRVDELDQKVEIQGLRKRMRSTLFLARTPDELKDMVDTLTAEEVVVNIPDPVSTQDIGPRPRMGRSATFHAQPPSPVATLAWDSADALKAFSRRLDDLDRSLEGKGYAVDRFKAAVVSSHNSGELSRLVDELALEAAHEDLMRRASDLGRTLDAEVRDKALRKRCMSVIFDAQRGGLLVDVIDELTEVVRLNKSRTKTGGKFGRNSAPAAPVHGSPTQQGAGWQDQGQGGLAPADVTGVEQDDEPFEAVLEQRLSRIECEVQDPARIQRALRERRSTIRGSALARGHVAQFGRSSAELGAGGGGSSRPSQRLGQHLGDSSEVEEHGGPRRFSVPGHLSGPRRSILRSSRLSAVSQHGAEFAKVVSIKVEPEFYSETNSATGTACSSPSPTRKHTEDQDIGKRGSMTEDDGRRGSLGPQRSLHGIPERRVTHDCESIGTRVSCEMSEHWDPTQEEWLDETSPRRFSSRGPGGFDDPGFRRGFWHGYRSPASSRLTKDTMPESIAEGLAELVEAERDDCETARTSLYEEDDIAGPSGSPMSNLPSALAADWPEDAGLPFAPRPTRSWRSFSSTSGPLTIEGRLLTLESRLAAMLESRNGTGHRGSQGAQLLDSLEALAAAQDARRGSGQSQGGDAMQDQLSDKANASVQVLKEDDGDVVARRSTGESEEAQLPADGSPPDFGKVGILEQLAAQTAHLYRRMQASDAKGQRLEGHLDRHVEEVKGLLRRVSDILAHQGRGTAPPPLPSSPETSPSPAAAYQQALGDELLAMGSSLEREQFVQHREVECQASEKQLSDRMERLSDMAAEALHGGTWHR